MFVSKNLERERERMEEKRQRQETQKVLASAVSPAGEATQTSIQTEASTQPSVVRKHFFSVYIYNFVKV